MKYVVEPYKSVGELFLGMKSEEISKIMGRVPKKFKRSPIQEYDSEKYPEFFVYYKKGGLCSAIELFSPAEVIFQEKKIFDLSFQKCKDLFQGIDDGLIIRKDGFTCLKYGIGVYAPYAYVEPQEMLVGIIIFEKGYYDKLL